MTGSDDRERGVCGDGGGALSPEDRAEVRGWGGKCVQCSETQTRLERRGLNLRSRPATEKNRLQIQLPFLGLGLEKE